MKKIAREHSLDAIDSINHLMHSHDFRQFYDKYFNNCTDIKSILLLMKTHHYLEQIHLKMHGTYPSDKYMKAGIRAIIANKETRTILVKTTEKFLKEDIAFDALIQKQIQNGALQLNCIEAENNDFRCVLK